MKFSKAQLIKYCNRLPEDEVDLRLLFDDLGLEVKSITKTDSDSILTIETLANRGDHDCYVGVAREICSRTKTKPNYPPIKDFDLLSYPNVNVEVHSDLCLSYSLTSVSLNDAMNHSLGKSADAILETMDTLTDNVLVNISNLVNYEIGQPLHFFDQTKINGNIIIRKSVKGEKALPLFSKNKIELSEGTLVISDQSKILAIAGVIGCEESKVDENTREILIESGSFDPVSVRKSSQRLGIHTNSIFRFQKGADLDLVITGSKLALTYLDQIGALATINGFFFEDKGLISERDISIDKDDLESLFNRTFSTEEIVGILESYGFNHKGHLSFNVPKSRIWDIKDDVDLYEEIARSIGYNSFVSILPNVDIGTLPSQTEESIGKTNEILVGAGFFEIFTDSFYSKDDFMKLNLNDSNPLYKHLEMINSTDKSYSLMKNNCLVQALEALSLNNRFKENNIKLFEWAKIFHPVVDTFDTESNEKSVLWGCVSGEVCDHFWKNDSNWEADIYFLKGLIEEIAFINQVEFQFQEMPSDVPESGLFHPFRRFSVVQENTQVGSLGELHPSVVKNFKIKSLRPYYFQIDRNALLGKSTQSVFTPPPSIPDIRRSMALKIPLEFQLKKIISYIEENSSLFFKRVAIKDQYCSPKENHIVYTFELFLDGEKKTSADDINGYLLELIKRITKEFGNEGVQPR